MIVFVNIINTKDELNFADERVNSERILEQDSVIEKEAISLIS